jgi:hypothetical protein
MTLSITSGTVKGNFGLRKAPLAVFENRHKRQDVRIAGAPAQRSAVITRGLLYFLTVKDH